MPRVRCPPAAHLSQTVQPLQDALLRAGLPETTLGARRPDKLCRKIRKGGGGEQYHANNKYAESVTVAAEACAEDTKGQTCYICTEVVHRRTGEGLVRGCACHTTEGYVHVSCLAEQAKMDLPGAESC